MSQQVGFASAWPVEFVEVDSADGRRLEGLRYEPSGDVSCQMLLLHGKGGNCYSGVCRFVPPALTAIGVRTLALNMRCHDLGYTRYDVPFVDIEEGHAQVDGGMWEEPEIGRLDVQAGLGVLARTGEQPIVVAGHSSGGFYAVTGSAGDTRVAGRILLSPLTSNRRPLSVWFGSPAALATALDVAQALVARGRGHELITVRSWYHATSATSLLARTGEDDRVWEDNLRRNGSPALMLWGSKESRTSNWQAAVETMPEPKRSVVLRGADHNYIGHESEVVAALADFLGDLT